MISFDWRETFRKYKNKLGACYYHWSRNVGFRLYSDLPIDGPTNDARMNEVENYSRTFRPDGLSPVCGRYGVRSTRLGRPPEEETVKRTKTVIVSPPFELTSASVLSGYKKVRGAEVRFSKTWE